MVRVGSDRDRNTTSCLGGRSEHLASPIPSMLLYAHSLYSVIQGIKMFLHYLLLYSG